MCGRYALDANLTSFRNRFHLERAHARDYHPRYNIAPTQEIWAILFDGIERKIQPMRWGLVPSWSKASSIGSRMINARAETLADNRVFNVLLQNKRCLIPATGFYEWRKLGKERIPTYITLRNQEPFAFAGLWDTWKSPSGELVESCTIITTKPNSLIAPIHDRMPVILSEEAESLWLSPPNDKYEVLTSLLTPFPEGSMRAYEVSKQVNSPRNDNPTCIEPAIQKPNIFDNFFSEEAH